MFGVNKEGRDTLSRQFKRGEQKPDTLEPADQSRVEQDIAFRSTLDSLSRNKGFLAELKNKVVATYLSEHHRNPTDKEINDSVQKQLRDRAMRLARSGQDEMGEHASRNSILRNK